MPRLSWAAVLIAACVVPSFAAVDKGLESLIPAGSTLLAGIEVDQSRGTNFAQFLLRGIDNQSLGNSEFSMFVQESGFDPRRDLQQVLFASAGGRTHSKLTVLARGNFDKDRIQALALKNGASLQKLEGVDVVTEGTGSHRHGLAFMGDGIVVIADKLSLDQIIGNRASATKLDSALLSQIETLSAKNAAWFVTTAPNGLMDATPVEGDQQSAQARVFRSILKASGGIMLSDHVDISVDAVTRSPQDAVSLADVIRMFVSMSQTQSTHNDTQAAIMAAVLKRMRLSAEGSEVHLTLSMTAQDMEKLAQSGPLAALTPQPAHQR